MGHGPLTMNDDFLHRIRVNPPADFLVALKAKLDGQSVALLATRRVSLRTLAIATFLVGIGVAIAVMVGREVPLGTQRHVVSNTRSRHPNITAPAPVAIQSPQLTATPNTSMPTAIATSPIPEAAEEKAAAGSPHAPIDMDWVWIPEGPFVMGASEEQQAEFLKFDNPNSRKRLIESAGPAHEVLLNGFYILRNLVTNQQYHEFTEATGHTHPDADPRFQGAKQPVVVVTWDDAQAFCGWVGARLPSEAEWEKAARGTHGLVYPWGNVWDSGKLQSIDGIAHQSFANQADYLSWKTLHIEDPEARTTNVGSFPQGASPYGVLDMAGNAWEWVNDWFDSDYYRTSPATNPKGPETGKYKVLRGGSWDAPRPVISTWMREHFMAPNTARRVTSFRCAKDAP
jgi:formylglycine-generating enzyme required for sulfatase activity